MKNLKMPALAMTGNIRKGIKELAEELGADFVKDCRRRYLEGEIERREIELKDFWERQELARKRGVHIVWRLAVLEWKKPEKMAKKIASLKMRLRMLDYKESNGITNEMIEMARSVDIKTLIETRSENWAICPFHPDKRPSLYLKNNFYHCFSCSETGSTIDLVMKRDGLGFIEAVKQLAGGG